MLIFDIVVDNVIAHDFINLHKGLHFPQKPYCKFFRARYNSISGKVKLGVHEPALAVTPTSSSAAARRAAGVVGKTMAPSPAAQGGAPVEAALRLAVTVSFP